MNDGNTTVVNNSLSVWSENKFKVLRENNRWKDLGRWRSDTSILWLIDRSNMMSELIRIESVLLIDVRREFDVEKWYSTLA